MSTQSLIAIAAQLGMTVLSVPEFCVRFAELGYTVDRSMDCRSTATMLNTGLTYPACTTGIKETDTGLSAWHVDARRDDKYKQMQQLRKEICAVSRNAILEV